MVPGTVLVESARAFGSTIDLGAASAGGAVGAAVIKTIASASLPTKIGAGGASVFVGASSHLAAKNFSNNIAKNAELADTAKIFPQIADSPSDVHNTFDTFINSVNEIDIPIPLEEILN